MAQNNDEFRFVSLLALELDNGDISLPSLPDVVLKIRKLLADENTDFERLSRAISMDPVLVSKLFIHANSAFYNRANVEIESLEVAISRLGIEAVRNTAMSLAMQQLYSSEKHSHAGQYLRGVWARGMKLSSMAFAVAARDPGLNNETAFLCGLLNEVGKLYIITKAEEFPDLLGRKSSFNQVLEKWNSQISKSIIESWGFPEEVAQSADPVTYVDGDVDTPATYADVMAVARGLVDFGQDGSLDFEADPSCNKLKITSDSVAGVMESYRDKLQSMQQSLT
ncbi:MAG: HDOD domain-containing protein [Woeseiaceae bacterium]|nr:HDOD domain-containing protein [Woeseiaceae bacterium]